MRTRLFPQHYTMIRSTSSSVQYFFMFSAPRSATCTDRTQSVCVERGGGKGPINIINISYPPTVAAAAAAMAVRFRSFPPHQTGPAQRGADVCPPSQPPPPPGRGNSFSRGRGLGKKGANNQPTSKKSGKGEETKKKGTREKGEQPYLHFPPRTAASRKVA